MESAKALAMYPKPVRTAILEVSQYPQLVSDLQAAKGKPALVNKAVSKYPASVRPHALLLAQTPQVIEILA